MDLQEPEDEKKPNVKFEASSSDSDMSEDISPMDVKAYQEQLARRRDRAERKDVSDTVYGVAHNLMPESSEGNRC